MILKIRRIIQSKWCYVWVGYSPQTCLFWKCGWREREMRGADCFNFYKCMHASFVLSNSLVGFDIGFSWSTLVSIYPMSCYPFYILERVSCYGVIYVSLFQEPVPTASHSRRYGPDSPFAHRTHKNNPIRVNIINSPHVAPTWRLDMAPSINP